MSDLRALFAMEVGPGVYIIAVIGKQTGTACRYQSLFGEWFLGNVTKCHSGPGSTSVPCSPSYPLSLFDLELRLRAPPLFWVMWAGLSLPDGGYIRNTYEGGTREVGGPER